MPKPSTVTVSYSGDEAANMLRSSHAGCGGCFVILVEIVGLVAFVGIMSLAVMVLN